MNKKRTIVTIIGVVLSTALMVGIGLLFASLRDNTIKTTIASRGSQHLTVLEVEGEKLNLLKNNVQIKNYSYMKTVGYGKVPSENSDKPYVLISEASPGILDKLKLISGRFPQNDTEVVLSSHMKTNGNISYKVGDQLEVDLGMRRYIDEEGTEIVTSKQTSFTTGEELQIQSHKKYKIVGVVERSYLENYSSPGYMVFTKNTQQESPYSASVYIEFKDLKNIFSKGEDIAKNLGAIEENIQFNDSLLASYGVSRYSNILDSMMGIIVIILLLISVGCIIVIYNSFAISVMERKKQFGLFSSIGATRKQIKHTVFFEALIIGIIGIPLGIIGSIFGIWTVLTIVNTLLPDVFQFPLALSIYPVYIIIPVLFMIAVIILSAYLPAKRASKITPIEAIRQNDDIKIKRKKVKTNKWIRKVFGIEGELALKNIKRNKRKYRITIMSLFISIVLFISFSSLMNLGMTASNEMVDNPDYDITVSINSKDEKTVRDVYEELSKNEEVKDILYTKNIYVSTDSLDSYFTDGTKQALRKSSIQTSRDELGNIAITAVDAERYKKAIQENKASMGDILYVNTARDLVYNNGGRKVERFDIFGPNLKSLPLYKIESKEERNDSSTGEGSFTKTKVYTLDRFQPMKKIPFAMEYATSIYSPSFMIPEEMFQEILGKMGEENSYINYTIYIKSPSYKNLEVYLKNLDQNHSFQSFGYFNIAEGLMLQKNMMFVFGLLLYGFIALVTLIGVTSVFNTINTSIALRRKEFAMLRSMGLTPRGFNKILYFESIFFGLKSLLYAVPVAIGVTFLIGMQVASIVTIEAFLLPFKSIAIAVVGVFIIVLMTMMYASSKIKKENILEAIREENI